MVVFQACKEVETNKSRCDILHANSSSDEVRELNKIVQRYASYIIMSKSLIESFIPAIFILFLGPWSDKYGRKPLIIAGYFGNIFILKYIKFFYKFQAFYMIN